MKPMRPAPVPPGVSLDVHGSLVRLGELFVKNTLEPAAKVKLWDNGLGDVLRTAVNESGIIPSITAVDVARAAGILRPAPRRVRGGGE